MNNKSLFDIYPWYRQHQQAVDTVASYLAIEVGHVLSELDRKINPQNPSNEIVTSEAA